MILSDQPLKHSTPWNQLAHWVSRVPWFRINLCGCISHIVGASQWNTSLDLIRWHEWFCSLEISRIATFPWWSHLRRRRRIQPIDSTFLMTSWSVPSINVTVTTTIAFCLVSSKFSNGGASGELVASMFLSFFKTFLLLVLNFTRCFCFDD